MIRMLKAGIMTLLLSIPLTVNAFAPANELIEPSVTAGCKTSAIAEISKKDILLSASNSLYTVSANRVFWGCWSYWPSGPCRAIYRENNGNYLICGQCDDFGNPGSGGCSRISSQTLNIGYWCS